MAERDGNPICGVCGLGCGLQAEQLLNHVLHLLLGGAAGPDDGVLDLRRRVFPDGKVLQRGRQQDCAAGMTEDHAGARVVAKEHAFDGHGIGPGARNDIRDAVVDLLEPLRERRRCVGANDATLQKRDGAAALLDDDAVARRAGTRIDAEDDHAPASAIADSSTSMFEYTFCTSSSSSITSSSFNSLGTSAPSTCIVVFGTIASSASSKAMPFFLRPS